MFARAKSSGVSRFRPSSSSVKPATYAGEPGSVTLITWKTDE